MKIPDKLYNQICKLMPIPCVDIIVTDMDNRVLLLKRNNQPMKGEWWFPGGRIYKGETRKEAALRKVKEECGINTESIVKIGTYDLFLNNNLFHAITTVFKVDVEITHVVMDDQSCDYSWKTCQEWVKIISNDFLLNNLKEIDRFY